MDKTNKYLYEHQIQYKKVNKSQKTVLETQKWKEIYINILTSSIDSKIRILTSHRHRNK